MDRGVQATRLRAGFVTHLHSDHLADLANLLLFGWYENLEAVSAQVRLIGPGSRGTVPPAGAEADEPAVVCRERPMPGFTDLVDGLWRAFATDINDRLRDNHRRHPSELLTASDIVLPDAVRFDPDADAAPAMHPFPVYTDDRVTVSAILVQHAPMAPAYAFRFDTPDGTVVSSGDTGPCENLVTLATGADVLVHEVIDEQWVQRTYGRATDPVGRAMVAHHTTAHTAIPDTGRIAEKAGVRTLVLHHFVPGEIDRPRWHEAADHFSGRLVVGTDLARIPLAE